jgi:hypothetical protein
VNRGKFQPLYFIFPDHASDENAQRSLCLPPRFPPGFERCLADIPIIGVTTLSSHGIESKIPVDDSIIFLRRTDSWRIKRPPLVQVV